MENTTTTDPELAGSFDDKSEGMEQFRLTITTAGMRFTSEPFTRDFAHNMLQRNAYWPANIPGANYIEGSDATGTEWKIV